MSNFYNEVYDRLYREGYHSDADMTHAKWLCKYMIKRLEFDTILDVGCSKGWVVEYMSKKGKAAYGCDASQIAIESGTSLGRKNLSVGLATDLPYEDNFFDVSMSTDMMEHLKEEDVDKAINEFYRVTTKYLAFKIADDHTGHYYNAKKLRRSAFRKAGLDQEMEDLHLTVKPNQWWIDRIVRDGAKLIKHNEKEGFVVDIRGAK